MLGLYRMMAIRQRNDPVRLFGRRLILGALLILVISAIWGVWSAYQKEQESRMLRTQAEVQRSDFTQRQTQLNSDIANLQTDRGKEGVLREQYALGAIGEGLIVIVDPPTPEPVVPTSPVMEWLHKVFPWW